MLFGNACQDIIVDKSLSVTPKLWKENKLCNNISVLAVSFSLFSSDSCGLDAVLVRFQNGVRESKCCLTTACRFLCRDRCGIQRFFSVGNALILQYLCY